MRPVPLPQARQGSARYTQKSEQGPVPVFQTRATRLIRVGECEPWGPGCASAATLRVCADGVGQGYSDDHSGDLLDSETSEKSPTMKLSYLTMSTESPSGSGYT